MRLLCAFLLATIATADILGQDRGSLEEMQLEQRTRLVQRVTDPAIPIDERDAALSDLEHQDFAKALEIAPTLLNTDVSPLRIRAAWIVASGGGPSGVQVLLQTAAERTEESVIAMSMLGRLKDPTGHPLLQTLLEKELDQPADQLRRERVPALIESLGDYADKRDAALLARAVDSGPVDWVDADALGRTGGPDAVPALDRIFQTGRGSTGIAAGLGLARCGSEKGISFVRARFADRSADPSKPNDIHPTNADTDDPTGPKASSFILSLLGVPADEVFVPDLLRIVSAPEYSESARAQAGYALLRIDPKTHRKELLELAWKSLIYEWAARYIVLHDEDRARKFVEGVKPERATYEQSTLVTALGVSPGRRRLWREIHGYSF